MPIFRRSGSSPPSCCSGSSAPTTGWCGCAAEANAAFAALEAELVQQVELVRAVPAAVDATQPAAARAGRCRSGPACTARRRNSPRRWLRRASARSSRTGIAALGAALRRAGAWPGQRAERDDAHDLAGPRAARARDRCGGPNWRCRPHAADRSQFNRRWRGTTQAIAQFPAVLLAWLFGFRPGRGAAIRAATVVLPWAQRPSRLQLPAPSPMRPASSQRRRCGACCRRPPKRCGSCAPGIRLPPRFESGRSAPAARRAGAGFPGAALARPRRGAARASWPSARRRRAADALLCTALALCWRDAERALRTLHAGRPGRRGGQAQPGHPRPGQLHQCLPAPLPARARCAGGRHRPRPGRAVEPPALVDRAAASTSIRSDWQRDAGGQQHAAADDACASTRGKSSPAQYLSTLAGGEHRGRAGRRARRGAGAAAAGARGARASPKAWSRCRMPPRNSRPPLLLHGLRAGARAAPLRILDACAAPGGKTAHLLELAAAPRSRRWTSIRRAASASTRPCRGWA